MTSRTVDSGCRVAHYARTRRQRDRGRRRVLLRGPPRRQQRRAPARPLHRGARKMNDCVRDEIWVTVPVTGGPRVFVRHVELSELCLLMCPSPPGGQLPAWAQFSVDKVMPLTLHLAPDQLEFCHISFS